MCGAMAVRFLADSEGWTAIYDCDDADRLTKVIYPGGATSGFPGGISTGFDLPEPAGNSGTNGPAGASAAGEEPFRTDCSAMGLFCNSGKGAAGRLPSV